MTLPLLGLVYAALSGCSAQERDFDTAGGAGGSAGTGKGPVTANGGEGSVGEQSRGIRVTTPSTVRVRRGGTASLAVTIERQGEFSGEVDVSVEGLPAGVGIDQVTLAAGATQANLTITAASSALPGGPTPISVEARAVKDDETFGKTSASLYTAGEPGSIDLSFGDDGLVTYPNAVAADLAVDSLGRIVVVGREEAGDATKGFVLRLTPTGELDNEFAGNGVNMAFGAPKSAVTNVALAGDAPIVSAVITDTDVTDYIRKLTVGGQVDSHYATGGDIDLSNEDVWQIITRGEGLIALLRDGSLLAFGSDGKQGASFSTDLVLPERSVAVDRQGQLLYAQSESSNKFKVGQLTAQGKADGSFGDGGVVTFSTAGTFEDAETTALAAYPDSGGVLLAKAVPTRDNPYGWRGLLFRFDEGGKPKESFGEAGVVVVTKGDEYKEPKSMVVQDDGMIIVEYVDPAPASSVVRLKTDGTVDTDFGDEGTVRLNKLAEQFEGIVVDAMAYDGVAGRLILASDSIWDVDGLGIIRLWL